MTTDTSEKGLETLIFTALTGVPTHSSVAGGVNEHRAAYGGLGYLPGNPSDYDREHAVDWAMLYAFLQETQPQAVEQLGLAEPGPRRRQFLHRLFSEVAKRGVVSVLRKGVSHGPAHVTLFYGSPSPHNPKAAALYAANRFSVTRQLRYSKNEGQLALDLCLLINGLPIATFELKNSLTKQTVADAVQQYKADRDPREPLFQFGRCAVHFAVDDAEVWMCTHLKGKASWFLPFNQGWNDGAGNPPNPHGLKTDYLWKEILTPAGLTDILENYAQIVEEKDEKTGKKKRRQIFPRYHQLEVVRRLLADVRGAGVGKRYLIQHSAGSGKSNSIAWLAHQLVGLEQAGAPLYDSVIVVTDRRVLDKQIRDTIRDYAQVAAIVGHAESSGDLRDFLRRGKKIIITTIQKFPFVLDEIGAEHGGRSYAILIDEAHSSQGGKTATEMHQVLADPEDTVNDALEERMRRRKLLANAGYFAFTATPKNKTLELFGAPVAVGDAVQHVPFHTYTMKQAIQEGFILDVLQNYTPVTSYYRLLQTVEDDPEFDVQRALKKLHRFVETNDHAIRTKTEIMVDHFHKQVAEPRKLGGQARAMVVTGGIQLAIAYYHAFVGYLAERKSPYRALVAFSGEHEVGGVKVTEASLNGFPSSQIPDRFVEDPYRFLIVADKFQTGYDEPLLHTMYVDKPLSDIKAVQTLSRLNRAHPHKRDTFVLDFVNDADTIQAAFAPYYRTTILSQETDPNQLHNLQADLDGSQVYADGQVDELVRLYLGGAERSLLDPILDACVAVYNAELDEEGQIEFKGKAKGFVRTYSFLAAILPYSVAAWEKLSIFLNFLLPKLPAPNEPDLAQGILEAVDMDSYRAEVQTALSLSLPDADGEVGPVPTGSGGHKPEPELDRLSNILAAFNDQFGNIDWKDEDKIARVIAEEIPAKVAANKRYQNAMQHSDAQNARIEHDQALEQVVTDLLADHAELFKQFFDNPYFRRWLADAVFAATYTAPKAA